MVDYVASEHGRDCAGVGLTAEAQRTQRDKLVRRETEAMQINQITDLVIRSAIEVHKALGLGLLESAYEACLAREMSLNRLSFERQKHYQLNTKVRKLNCGYRLDFLVEGLVGC